jgi:PAS domain S-box-containing protein
MAALVRAKDWSGTPLGPADTWPQSLRIAAGICLSSRFPMFLWWGPDLINIYNDAYIPILGRRHPDALGRSAPDVWREVWPVIGPQVEAVMTRGEASWQKRVPLVVERNGYPEEAYFTWSHSPVSDADGRVSGVLCVVTEETTSVLAERERDRLVEERTRVDERSQTILESITDAFFAVDQEWRGSLIDVSISLDPVIDGEGRVAAAAATVRDIGWQKRVEADLRAEQERYRALFERAAVGMAEVDLGGHFVRVNAEYGRITGCSPKELVGRHTSTITHPDDAAADNVVREMIICGGGGTVRREKRYLRQDGEVVWVDLAVTLVRDDAGRPSRLISTVADITARKRAEEQLRRSHDTFYNLIQNNPFGVYVVDADFKLAQVSIGAQKVFANVRPLLGRDFAEVLRDVWAEPFATEAINRFRHTLDTGERYMSPSTVEPRQGTFEIEAYDWRIERVMLPDGRFGVVCYFYDLSERQRWEATLRESEAALREMAERFERHSRLFERIAATTLDFIYVFDLKGRFLYANRRLLEVWGRTFEDSVGKSLYELGYPQWHADMHMAEIKQVIET